MCTWDETFQVVNYYPLNIYRKQNFFHMWRCCIFHYLPSETAPLRVYAHTHTYTCICMSFLLVRVFIICVHTVDTLAASVACSASCILERMSSNLSRFASNLIRNRPTVIFSVFTVVSSVDSDALRLFSSPRAC